jgi:hypothetical protein
MDIEQLPDVPDAIKLKGISKKYCFFADSKQPNMIWHKEKPCYCKACLAWKFAKCVCKLQHGDFKLHKYVRKDGS